MTNSKRINRQILEKDFLNNIVKLARLSGWLVYHTYDSRRSEKGYPDITMTRHGRIIFAEVKREGEAPTVEQTIWLKTLAENENIEVYLWYPSEWENVESILKG